MSVQHKNQTLEDGIHTPFAWIVADETARSALILLSSDVNKILLQLDTNQIYRLASISPAVWELTPDVTKSGIGLSNVENYPPASQLQAESGIDNSTYMTPLRTAQAISELASAAGEANTASNLGTGSGVFDTKVGVNLRFKSLVAAGGISITSASEEITISGGGGSTSWGDITGTLSTQTDLNSVLSNKLEASDIANFETTAQLNIRDTNDRARSNHTGTQAISTVSGLQTQLDTKLESSDIANFETTTELNSRDTANRDRANHTGTQVASTISDFQTTVSANTDVTANTAKVTNATHIGDVTGATTLTIANNAVDNVKAADMATSTIKGRITADTGNPEDLTATSVRTIINVANGATANSADATLLARANHTGTQTASTISDFDTEVANNTDVASNTTHRSLTSNPHSVTATQVGLGNVENYGIATQIQAETGTDNATYMTPLRTAEAIAELASAAGEANTASSLGTGESVFGSKSGVDLRFKSLIGGDNINITSTANEITISGMASGGGSNAPMQTGQLMARPTGFAYINEGLFISNFTQASEGSNAGGVDLNGMFNIARTNLDIDQLAGFYGPENNSSLATNFRFQFKFRLEEALTHQLFIGMSAAADLTAATDVDAPDNSIGIQYREGTDTVFQAYCRNGATTQRVSTGVTVATGTTWIAEVENDVSAGEVYVRLLSADYTVLHSETFSANLPASSTAMKYVGGLRKTTADFVQCHMPFYIATLKQGNGAV